MTHALRTSPRRPAAALALLATAALLAAAPAFAGRPLFELSDPRGDDHGGGGLVYPANDDYTRGDLDLVAFAARLGDGGTWFEATFARPIREPDRRAIDGLGTSLASVARQGFYTFNLEVYVDTDRVPGSGGLKALPGRKAHIARDTAWERAIVLTPRPHEARGELKRLLARRLGEEIEAGDASLEAMRATIPEGVEDHFFFPNLVRVRGSKVSFFVPDAFFGGPARADWAYVVAVSGADLLQTYDLQARLLDEDEDDALMILSVGTGRPRDRFGASQVYDLLPPLIDILTPVGVRQEEVLRTFLRTDAPVELPGVVPDPAGP